jgi:hypothetical protein
MSPLLKRLLPARLVAAHEWKKAMREWERRRYEAPSPPEVKRVVLVRNGAEDATWVETGTYLGDTAAFLARHARAVVTIEPEPELFRRAAQRFAGQPKVRVVNGTSEAVLPGLLPELQGPVCFWLDGHYSAGITFRGAQDTPIQQELATIEGHLSRLGSVVVLVDDIRMFTDVARDPAYPPLGVLVEWAARNGLDWHIEHDIFVARRGAPAAPAKA